MCLHAFFKKKYWDMSALQLYVEMDYSQFGNTVGI